MNEALSPDFTYESFTKVWREQNLSETAFVHIFSWTFSFIRKVHTLLHRKRLFCITETFFERLRFGNSIVVLRRSIGFEFHLYSWDSFWIPIGGVQCAEKCRCQNFIIEAITGLLGIKQTRLDFNPHRKHGLVGLPVIVFSETAIRFSKKKTLHPITFCFHSSDTRELQDDKTVKALYDKRSFSCEILGKRA